MTPTFSFTVRSAVRSSSSAIFSTPGMQVHNDSMSRMNFHSSGGWALTVNRVSRCGIHCHHLLSLKSSAITPAALCPAPACTPPPGWQ